jgi:DNA modification methylase
MISDVMSGGQEKSYHDWQQAESEAAYWIDRLCPADGIVCDPFLGGGTTAAAAEKLGRKWIGFEIDEDSAAICRKRVCK